MEGDGPSGRGRHGGRMGFGMVLYFRGGIGYIYSSFLLAIGCRCFLVECFFYFPFSCGAVVISEALPRGCHQRRQLAI